MLKARFMISVFLLSFFMVNFSAVAKDDYLSMRESGMSGQTSCGEFFEYIKDHAHMPDNVTADNARFVIMLIIKSQTKDGSLHRHGDEMTPERVHNYEGAFAHGCKQDPNMSIALAMTRAVATIDSRDPV